MSQIGWVEPTTTVPANPTTAVDNGDGTGTITNPDGTTVDVCLECTTDTNTWYEPTVDADGNVTFQLTNADGPVAGSAPVVIPAGGCGCEYDPKDFVDGSDPLEIIHPNYSRQINKTNFVNVPFGVPTVAHTYPAASNDGIHEVKGSLSIRPTAGVNDGEGREIIWLSENGVQYGFGPFNQHNGVVGQNNIRDAHVTASIPMQAGDTPELFVFHRQNIASNTYYDLLATQYRVGRL